jgi:predicted kinase
MADTLRLLVITGLPATGKTALAHRLARGFGAALLAKDDVKEPLLDVLGAADRQASRRLSEASFAVLFALARAQLTAAVSVLLEGNFRREEHSARLAQLLETPTAHAVRCAQVLCEAPETLRRARLAARAHEPTRHAGHRDAELLEGAEPSGERGGEGWLILPGERFVHRGFETAEWPLLSAALERWWLGEP